MQTMKKLSQAIYQYKVRNLQLIQCIVSKEQTEVIIEDNDIIPIIRIYPETFHNLIRRGYGLTDYISLGACYSQLKISSEGNTEFFKFWFDLYSRNFERSRSSAVLRIGYTHELTVSVMGESYDSIQIYTRGNNFEGQFRIPKKKQHEILHRKPPFIILDDTNLPQFLKGIFIHIDSNERFRIVFEEKNKAYIEMIMPLLHIRNALRKI